MPELRLNEIDFPSMLATYAWGNSSIDYAADVHNGESGFGGFAGIARPFTEVAIAEYPVEQRFAELMVNSTIEAAFTAMAEELGDRFKGVIDNHDWGINSKRVKRFKDSPTWKTITDSGSLRNSQQLNVGKS
jgi:hypothetical protein